MIHRKLEVMRKCYQERNAENFGQFYDAFFDRNRLPIIIGTDNSMRYVPVKGAASGVIDYLAIFMDGRRSSRSP